MREPFLSSAFRGVPTFFRACCCDVKHQLACTSYAHPGRELMRHLDILIPDGLSVKQWDDHLSDLARLIEVRDEDDILRWFVDHYPKCMALVPKRRRAAFLEGVYDMAEGSDFVAQHTTSEGVVHE